MGRVKRSTAVIRFIEGQCRIPEGRDVGKPVKLRPWQKAEIKRIYDNPHGTRRGILSFGRKNGKGLALDTPIPTPSGWTTMGELQEGDYVYGSDGKMTQVLFVSPVHTGLKCWRLTFSDGSSIVADEQHRWLTRHSYRPWAKARRNGSGNGGRWRTDVVTTPQIAESVYRGRKDGGKEHNHKIQIAPALIALDDDLPIDPYVLGAWLGDGTSACAAFTCSEGDLPHLVGELESALGIEMTVSRYAGKAPTVRATGSGLQSLLRSHGLLGNKHVPEKYFGAGTRQRWALLQGLMDTDGTVSRNGGRYARASFTGTNEALCFGVWRLARSLGLKATISKRQATLNGKVIGDKWDVAFAADRGQPVFRLSRKQELLPDSTASRSSTLTVVSCEPVESVPTVCIQVAAADSLFLAGYGCVPTHNTALSSFLLLTHLCGPEAKHNSQLYSAAQSRDQAAILFSLAAKIVRMSPTLSEYVVIKDSAKQLVCPELGTMYRALSADASTAYGLSPVFVVHDELGQVRGPKSELYEAIETAAAAHDSPLSIVISTQAPTDGDLLSLLIDDAKTEADPRVVVSLYTADDDVDPFSEEAMRAANPAFGDFQNADEVKAMAETAKRLPSSEASYRNLILNQRVEARNPFVARKTWDANGAKPEMRGRVYGGLDLSSVHDLTALVLVDSDSNSVLPTFWLPESGIVQKSQKDRVPYDVWAKSGDLELCPGKSIEYEWVAHRLRQVFDDYDVAAIAFDRWGMRHLRPWLQKAGFTEDELAKFVEFGQGFKDMSPALRSLESLLLNEKLRHGMHPVLRMCAANAVAQQDPAGNRKLAKDKSSGRIDGIVALAMAVGVMAMKEDDAEVDLSWLDDPIMVNY